MIFKTEIHHADTDAAFISYLEDDSRELFGPFTREEVDEFLADQEIARTRVSAVNYGLSKAVSRWHL